MLHGKDRTAPAVLLAFLVITALTFSFAHISSTRQNIILTLSFLSFCWCVLAILQVNLRCRKLGLRRSSSTRLLSGPRPADPDELAIWHWTLQACCSILAFITCMVALPFAP